MVKFTCSGWWEQQGYGRQAMDGLEMSFEEGRIHGGGTDLIGDFVFSGAIEGENIRLQKQYIGQHHIEYQGTYDGEGTYYGRWNYADYLGGKWLIHVGRSPEPRGASPRFESPTDFDPTNGP